VNTCVRSPTAERPLSARRVQQFQQELAINTCVWLGIGLPPMLCRQQRYDHIMSSLWG
jgi:hypothetical protein